MHDKTRGRESPFYFALKKKLESEGHFFLSGFDVDIYIFGNKMQK